MAVATLLAVAGCTGDSEDPPTTTPPTSPAASPSETPSPTPTPDAATPPERPDMSAIDAATAEAVATYFVMLFPYVFATGDLSEWDALSHLECIYCASVRSGVEEFRAAAHHSEGGLVTVAEATSTETAAGQVWMVTFTMTEQPSVTVDADNTVIEAFPDTKTYDSAVVVVYQGGRWQVREVTHERRML